ncbi:RDD family protein [Psychroflexus sp. YR1-1]|uniref:RDD family protein n=1 Tax=Psychroflexus aurantiacus TaxID=2709310 RepID=A0A6B3R6U1_9FLAO|nr:RDD family protein [Psychroflexus aurantiacus]NEV93521.1 RDD family protein [Psychroflexus aurantiacus]
MSHFQIETAQNVKIQQSVATVWDRILAYLIDSIVILAYVLATTAVMSGLMDVSPFESMATSLVLGLPPFLYHLLMETFMNGQSVGKASMGLRVVNLDGSRPQFSGYLIRWLLRIVEISLVSGAIAIVAILINGKGQRLGDIAARTTVITERRKTGFKKMPLFEIDASYLPHYPQVATLKDEDVRRIKSVYDKAEKDGDHAILIKLADKVAGQLQVENSQSSKTFIQTVLKDYQYYSTQ